jgi:hypothetical protein
MVQSPHPESNPRPSGLQQNASTNCATAEFLIKGFTCYRSSNVVRKIKTRWTEYIETRNLYKSLMGKLRPADAMHRRGCEDRVNESPAKNLARFERGLIWPVT